MDNSRLSELDYFILYYQNLTSSFSKYHPPRVPSVRALAETRFGLYENPQDNLNQSILSLTEAILLPLPCCDGPLNIVQTFWKLTVALSIRADKLKLSGDVKCCVIFFRYLQDQLPGVIPDVATAYLVDALALKVELELGDVREDIEEIVDLCHKLLNSNVSTSSQKVVSLALERLGVVRARFGNGNRWEQQRIIQSLREANTHLPDLHKASIAVTESLSESFKRTHSIGDYEEGTSVLDSVIDSCAGDTPSPYREIESLSTAAHQLYISGKPDHIEEAIYRLRDLLDVISPDHPLRPSYCGVLSALQNMRGLDQVDIGGTVRDIHSSNLESRSHPSFHDLTTSLAQSNMGTFSESEHIEALFRIPDMSEIEDGVKYCRQLVSSPLATHFVHISSHALYLALIRAFRFTNKIEYFNEAISLIPDNPSQDPGAHTLTVQRLIRYLTIHFRMLDRGDNEDELMQLFPSAINNIRTPIPGRFRLSCQWAHLARFLRLPSIPTAYDRAMSLMQANLTFSPTLHSQHLRLVAMRDSYEKLPLDYASYLVDRGQLEKAIETLEQGRALMWSEMRGFRTSIDKIRTVDSVLADRFAAVNRELEILTSSNDLDGGDCVIERMDPYGDLVVRQQRLLDDREKLISHIRTIPGFENFMDPLSFDILRSAALRGPVIIINHCAWRSDIIILLRDSPPSLIPTSDDFYDRADKLRNQLVDARRKGLDSKEYEKALNSVLKELYELVGQPVIKRLNELRIPKQSRVWWCPTSAFCALPLHAMGPIPSDDRSKRYFMDLYIPSYTPSLSALIESHKSDLRTLNKPSILLVVQPDASMPAALKEMKVVRGVNTQVTTLFSKKATPAAMLRHLRDHRFAHIVCHGTLEEGKPFDASFELYAGGRLSLLDIVRSQLPNAEFAFLSACHTAELTEESIADESLHLTAAMQYCGFRSVVAAMWAMADVDGRDLARDFYRSVFADERQGVCHYERTAEALRDAVQRLRRKGGISSERWVNFVHYGA